MCLLPLNNRAFATLGMRHICAPRAPVGWRAARDWAGICGVEHTPWKDLLRATCYAYDYNTCLARKG